MSRCLFFLLSKCVIRKTSAQASTTTGSKRNIDTLGYVKKQGGNDLSLNIYRSNNCFFSSQIITSFSQAASALRLQKLYKSISRSPLLFDIGHAFSVLNLFHYWKHAVVARLSLRFYTFYTAI